MGTRGRKRGQAEDQLCGDTRPCFFRSGGYCTALSETYVFNGECPFAKKNINDIAYNTLKRRRKK